MSDFLDALRRIPVRLRESVAASSEPALQRGGSATETPEERKRRLDREKNATTDTDDDKLRESPSQAERDKASADGDTMEGGKYPIRNQAEADKAWNLRNNGDADEASVVAHIRKQVKKHGLTMPGSTRESDLQPAQHLGLIQLREARVEKKGGAYEVTIVREGPGNPGDANYYTKQALREAVNRKLFEGLQAYLNHPTVTEERERPERDVRYLAGQFREARYVDGNPAEVRAKFYPGGMDKDRVVTLIESALESPADRPLVGISIDGYGQTAGTQEINGRTYNLVREVAHLGSADIVTRAGAGGRFHRRLSEAWRNPGAEARPGSSQEATMKPAQLQEKVKSGLGKLSEAAGLKDDEKDRADTLIKEGFAELRECETATIEPDVRIQEKQVEVPVAASGEKADELAARLKDTETRLADTETRLTESQATHKAVSDELATLKSGQSAIKVMRDKQVPDRFRESWFPEIAAQADEAAMGAYVDRKLAERQAYLDEFQDSVGVEGAGPRQLRETRSGDNAPAGLLGRMGIDPDELDA